MSDERKSPTCILLVTYDYIARQDAVRHLRSDDCAVWCVDTLDVAAEHMRALIPDVVLLDMAAASDDAAGFIARMREEPGLLDVPVILLTRDRTLAEDDIARDMGASRFLVLPFQPVSLRRYISAAVTQHRLAARAVRVLVEKGIREEWARLNLLGDRPEPEKARTPDRLTAHTTPV